MIRHCVVVAADPVPVADGDDETESEDDDLAGGGVVVATATPFCWLVAVPLARVLEVVPAVAGD